MDLLESFPSVSVSYIAVYIRKKKGLTEERNGSFLVRLFASSALVTSGDIPVFNSLKYYKYQSCGFHTIFTSVSFCVSIRL